MGYISTRKCSDLTQENLKRTLFIPLQGSKEDENAIYSGSAEVRIPIRWSAIEVCKITSFPH